MSFINHSPLVFSAVYDAANNDIWAFDAVNNEIGRFVNEGIAPKHLFPHPGAGSLETHRTS